MMVEDSGQISVRTVWLTIVHVFIVLYVGVRNIARRYPQKGNGQRQRN